MGFPGVKFHPSAKKGAPFPYNPTALAGFGALPTYKQQNLHHQTSPFAGGVRNGFKSGVGMGYVILWHKWNKSKAFLFVGLHRGESKKGWYWGVVCCLIWYWVKGLYVATPLCIQPLSCFGGCLKVDVIFWFWMKLITDKTKEVDMERGDDFRTKVYIQ